ncbi:MAG TPA: efflux RND transporter permease subunit [Longimicrobiales bacterium]|nr:efflux RND transporter permease subunit [Longimicrobiales bacterium]
MSLPRLSIARPVGVAMFFIGVLVIGAISFERLPTDLLPDVSYPRLVIYTGYPDVAPTEVERLVTAPVEAQVAAVAGVERIESVSREGASYVTLRFAWGTDMDFAALAVREKLDNLRDLLPDLADRPVVLRTDPTADPVMALSVTGPVDLWGLKEQAETVFKRRLEQIDGVAQAAVVGGLDREIQVDVDPRRLENLGLTVEDIARALEAANVSAPGGSILRGRARYSLRTLGEFQAVDEIENVVVGAARGGSAFGDGSPAGGAGGQGGEGGGAVGSLIRVGDVATVRDGFRERESIARANGEEAVGLLLFKESGANTVQVAERVDEALVILREEYPDLSFTVPMSQAGFISDAISNVAQALLLGGILAFLVLFLFLRDARYPVAVALAIPISVIGTFALMEAAGVSLNIMSLGGLALGVGMLVDNSIVVLENVFRHREAASDSAAEAETAARGAEEVTGAITASTLTTIAVFGPVLYVRGVAGELFGDLSLAVAFSLLASLLVAITLLPAMAARWGTGAGGGGWARRGLRAVGRGVGSAVGRAARPGLDAFDSALHRFARWYHGVLESALRHRGRVVLAAAGMLAVALFIGLFSERSVLPEVEQGAFQARLELPRGTPLDVTDEAARRVETTLLADDEVEAVFTRVGRQNAVGTLNEDEGGLHTAVLEVRLRGGASSRAVIARTRAALADLPAGALTMETGQATALGRLVGGEEAADLAVRVRGDEIGPLVAYALRLEAALAEEPELENVRLGVELGQPEVRLAVDRARLASYGLRPADLSETVEAYMRGTVATEFVAFDRRIPVVVRLPEGARRDPTTLDRLRVGDVPLRQLVRSTEQLGPAEVRRLDQSRYVPIYADAEGSVDEGVREVEAAVAGLAVPRGMRVEVAGENTEMRRSFRELAFAFALALLLVYMILAAQFESFLHPFTILLSVPLALVGALVALTATGSGLNTMSLIGVVILVGIVVNDAIVKVDFINQARARGAEVRDAILEAGEARLRPILMTTVTTVLGLTPMALGIGRGADLRAPLAIAVIGGLIAATALTLVVVPVAYALVEDLRAAVVGRRAEDAP